MNKVIFSFVIIAFLISCKTDKPKIEESTLHSELKPISNSIIESAVIYEANIRQYSKEGTFEKFTQDIPKLKELGVKILWLMPVFPISETKRKATGDKFVEEIENKEERKKYLGSYYAVSNFKKINPEFGTIEDFRTLLKTAHQNGIYVILDWVPNHTGWDHEWIKKHPDYYTKNKKGEITDPLNEDGTPVGWADVADLDYSNKNLRKNMIEDMKYWILKENIDGFRCDVAGSVPINFWQEAIPELRKEKSLFMLAEAWEPALMNDDLFDMAYGWGTHHVMNEIAQGKKDVKAWDTRMKEIDSMYQKDDILMNFTSNHDENSWNGTVKERLGDASELFAILSYLAPGMPLIYSGQEYDLDKRLLFFEKDSINKTKGEFYDIYKNLGKLKNNNIAVNGGKNAANYLRINTSDNNSILAFSREKNKKKIYFIGNLSSKSMEFTLPVHGSYVNYMNSKPITILENESLNLDKWEYLILIPK